MLDSVNICRGPNWGCESIYSCGQYVTVQFFFSHPSSVIYFFCKATHTTVTRTENRWCTTNSKPPGLIIMMGQSQTLSSNKFIFIMYTLFCRFVVLLRLWHPLQIVPANNGVIAEHNYFPELNRHILLTFLHPNCTLHVHIVSTAGDALTADAARHNCTLKAITFQLNFRMLKVQILNT
jgi:hypothetical protein